MGYYACSLSWAVQKAPRARTRAGDHGRPPVCARRAFVLVCSESKSRHVGLEIRMNLLAVTDVISKLGWALVYVLYYARSEAQPRMRALCSPCAVRVGARVRDRIVKRSS